MAILLIVLFGIELVLAVMIVSCWAMLNGICRGQAELRGKLLPKELIKSLMTGTGLYCCTKCGVLHVEQDDLVIHGAPEEVHLCPRCKFTQGRKK